MKLLLLKTSLLITIPIAGMEINSTLVLPKGCNLKPEVVAALIQVNKELNAQKLGLKFQHAYRPETNCLKKRPDRYWIDVRQVDSNNNLVEDYLRGYFSGACSTLKEYDIYQELTEYRRVMKECLTRHGFIHKIIYTKMPDIWGPDNFMCEDTWEYRNSFGAKLCVLCRN